MFQCKDLMSLNTMARAKLVSGAEGLFNTIRWFYTAEDVHFEDWIHGGELLIISSSLIQDPQFQLEQVIRTAIDIKMSCALILYGKNYITDVPPSVLDLSEKNNFPIFLLPWDIPLVDLYEELGRAISYLDETSNLRDRFLSEVIFGNGLNSQVIQANCREMGINEKVLEQVFLIHLNGLKNDQVVILATWLQSLFHEHNYTAMICSYGDRIIGFMQSCEQNRQPVLEIFDSFHTQVQQEYRKISYTSNVSGKCNSTSDIAKSFQEISKINVLLEKLHKTDHVFFYEEMRYFRMLIQYEQLQPMVHFMENVLGKLIQYDESKHTHLIDTLWCYFENNCNLQETSEAIFTHKNTVKYRLKRIQEITGMDLTVPFQHFELYQALILYYYLK